MEIAAANHERWNLEIPNFLVRDNNDNWAEILVEGIEDPSEETWNTVCRKLVINWTRINNPQLVCQTLFRKFEEVGCNDKNSACNIAKLISFCLNDLFEFYTSPTNYFKPLLIYNRYMFEVQVFHKIFKPSSEVHFLKLLLNYDLLQPIDINSESNLEEVNSTIRTCFHNAPEMELLDFNTVSLRSHNEQYLLLKQLQSSDGRLNGAFQRGFKRLMLTGKCIPILEEECRHTTAELHAQCMRLYFRAVTDPFVQAEEVREFMSFFFQNAKEEAIDEMVTVFQSLLPESIAPYGPRSLQHLCRCRVREILSPKSQALPWLLNSLKIPYRLKVYILGDF